MYKLKCKLNYKLKYISNYIITKSTIFLTGDIMRFLFVGGGTAGHVNPALAIASTIKNNVSDAAIYFVGSKNGIENSLVPDAGYNLFQIDVTGLKRSLSLSNIKAVFTVLKAVRNSKKLLKKIRPDIVIGTG